MSSPRPMPFPRPPDPAPAPRRAPKRPEPQSWLGALLLILAAGAVLWVVQFFNAGDHYRLDRFGLQPRAVGGLWGIVTMPLLHASYNHLLSNTLPFLGIGWVVMLSGPRVWATATAMIVVIGGALTWLCGPADTEIVGASGLIMGWLGYLMARAYFTRKLRWILGAAMVLSFFGTLLFGVLPSVHSDVSWQAHLCGFVAGLGVGAYLHPRRGETRLPRLPAVS